MTEEEINKDAPTPKRRRELLRELTKEAIEAGTYGEVDDG